MGNNPNWQIGDFHRGFWGYNAVCADTREGTVVLYATFISRSKTLAKGVANTFGLKNVSFSRWGRPDRITKGFQYAKAFKPVKFGLDRFTLGVVRNKEIGTRFLITTPAHLEDDFYNFLMRNFQVELLPAWTAEIREELVDNRRLVRLTSRYAHKEEKPGTTISLHGEEVPLADLLVYSFQLTEDQLEEVVEALGNEGRIRISEVLSKKLDVTDLNSYITIFGRKGALKIAENTTPLVPEEEAVDLPEVALNVSSLIPQQIRAVNGVIALMEKNKHFAIMCEGMGCGKTKQAISAMLGRENRRSIRLNGDHDLKEMYLNGHKPSFRAIVMCPPHLCEMWKRDFLKEVPYGEAHILKSLHQLMELRDRGPERTGAELYIISKEFCKTDSFKSPIPSKVAKMLPKVSICADCYNEGPEDMANWVLKPGGRDPRCPRCSGRNFMPKEITRYGKLRGMVCPRCGNILLKYLKSFIEGVEDPDSLTLMPEDFASHKEANDRCYVCGEGLWGADVENIGYAEGKKPERSWYKISHYKNYQHKSKVTAFVLKGPKGQEDVYKDRYLAVCGGDTGSVAVLPKSYGPRKASPAQFIKKHMKGFFDYCVLDECHKYEGAGTAQAVAAQALVKASGFTLALTGTISNGKADSLFYLLFMLCPRKMKKKGYSYGDVMKFVRDYGSIETCYEASYADEGVRNANSRGRQIGSPRVKPGISPLLQLDFLTGHTVFLDLSDMADFLPPLNEHVITAEMPDDVRSGYNLFMERMKNVLKGKGGRAYLASWLQTSLAYPSKPWGVPPIMSVKEKGVVVCAPENFPKYSSLDTLLPKEQAFIEKVQEEVDEGRNIFVYCSFTGDPGKNCTGRLKALIERYCNLEGQVLIMEAGKPEAVKREAFIHQKAAEGYKVIICNQKLVETGLDFCFDHEGVHYNYPTIMVYQLTYELAVQMQSTRRHYRLNQTEECRTYYFVTECTAEMAALSLMADKQVAAAALQGNFNAEGIAAMASGVDDKVKLIQMMEAGDMGDAKAEIEAKFGKLTNSQSKATNVAELFNRADRPKTFPELMGQDGINSIILTAGETAEAEQKKAVTVKKQESKVTAFTVGNQMSLFDIDGFEDLLKPRTVNEGLTDLIPQKKRKKVVAAEGQQSLLSLFAA